MQGGWYKVPCGYDALECNDTEFRAPVIKQLVTSRCFKIKEERKGNIEK